MSDLTFEKMLAAIQDATDYDYRPQALKVCASNFELLRREAEPYLRAKHDKAGRINELMGIKIIVDNDVPPDEFWVALDRKPPRGLNPALADSYRDALKALSKSLTVNKKFSGPSC